VAEVVPAEEIEALVAERAAAFKQRAPLTVKAAKQVIQRVLDENPGKVTEYRGGKKGLTGFFTGQVMKATNGQADPKTVAKLLSEMLG